MVALASFVQVAADGVGKKVQNLLTYQIDANGNEVPVYVQVVTLANADGTVAANLASEDTLAAVLAALGEIKDLLTLMMEGT